MTRRHQQCHKAEEGGYHPPHLQESNISSSATPPQFDYDEFSKFIVDATPGALTPGRSKLRRQSQRSTSVPGELDTLDGYECMLPCYSRFKKDPNASGVGGVGSARKRELLAWTFVVLQTCIIAIIALRSHFSSAQSAPPQMLSYDQMTRMNDKPVSYYEERRISVTSGSVPNGGVNPADGVPNPAGFYNVPILHPLSEPALAERKWRSNGSPYIHPDLKQGTCWCSADEWCMCTPSLAIDVVLKSGPDHVWLVQRADTGLLALMGGMNEVGETVEDAVHRELAEEMSIKLPPSSPLILFGVYNDPMRDARRHTTSAVYIVDVPNNMQPKAGDDATDVIRLPLSEVESHEFFVDHKTILRDYMKVRNRATTGNGPLPGDGDGEPFRRSVCPMV